MLGNRLIRKKRKAPTSMCVKEEDENESTMDKEMARRMRE
jgi:hypothetical protein